MSGTVFLICGKICSGKSFYAERLRKEKSAVLLSVDEITLAIFGDHIGEKHDEVCENVQKYLFEKSLETAEVGCNVILDWGFWQKEDREYARKFYEDHGVPCEFHYIDVSDRQWRENISERNRAITEGTASAYYVDDNLAAKFGALFEMPTKDEIDVWYTNERKSNHGRKQNMENITIRTADKNDIETLIKFRFLYMTDVEGELSEEQTNALRGQLPVYFEKHMGRDFTAYLAEDSGKPAGVIFMVRLEKPASVHFLSGSTCYLMNVYTHENYRRKGIASKILDRLILDAKAEGITCIDLSATEMGKPLYLKKGFIPRGNTEMRMELKSAGTIN